MSHLLEGVIPREERRVQWTTTCVRFHNQVQLTVVPAATDAIQAYYDNSNPGARWYTSEELDKLEMDCINTARGKNGAEGEMRGIEHFRTDALYVRWQLIKRRALHAVLREQARQQEESLGAMDREAIRETSIRFTSWSRVKAKRSGYSDAATVRNLSRKRSSSNFLSFENRIQEHQEPEPSDGDGEQAEETDKQAEDDHNNAVLKYIQDCDEESDDDLAYYYENGEAYFDLPVTNMSRSKSDPNRPSPPMVPPPSLIRRHSTTVIPDKRVPLTLKPKRPQLPRAGRSCRFNIQRETKTVPFLVRRSSIGRVPVSKVTPYVKKSDYSSVSLTTMDTLLWNV